MTTSAETLSNLWEELAAPSARVFLKALQARGIQVRSSDVREFISSKSERQVLQPGNRFTGKVVALDKNDGWAADVISYTSRPVVKDGKRTVHPNSSGYVLALHSMHTPSKHRGHDRSLRANGYASGSQSPRVRQGRRIPRSQVRSRMQQVRDTPTIQGDTG